MDISQQDAMNALTKMLNEKENVITTLKMQTEALSRQLKESECNCDPQHECQSGTKSKK